MSEVFNCCLVIKMKVTPRLSWINSIITDQGLTLIFNYSGSIKASLEQYQQRSL